MHYVIVNIMTPKLDLAYCNIYKYNIVTKGYKGPHIIIDLHMNFSEKAKSATLQNVLICFIIPEC